MEKFDIYNDIAKRTDGDIYIGVVGPVRTGKSSFVAGFMNNVVLPAISGKNKKLIATDEMPQSGQGKTIMTTEPKFIPSEAVNISLKNKVQAKVRLIDSVGFVVDGSLGALENDKPRMVKTPWFDEEIPFEKAAEIGTQKVINDHSTIGILVTTDGSFTDIPRENYVKAEERCVSEMKELGKPFTILLNCKDENSKTALELKNELEQKYEVPVCLMNVLESKTDKYIEVLENVLLEFPMNSFDIKLPRWMQALRSDSKIINYIIESVKNNCSLMCKMRDYTKLENAFSNSEYLNEVSDVSVNMGEGRAEYNLTAKDGVFLKVLSEECGENITDDYSLMSYIKNLAVAKNNYDKLKSALDGVQNDGYGITRPIAQDIEVSEPILVKNGNRYGVKIDAKAESMHIVKVNVTSTINPMVGTKKQCQEFIDYLNNENQQKGLINANVFGKPLYELVSDDITYKTDIMPNMCKNKLKKTFNKMVNDKKYRVWCILM